MKKITTLTCIAIFAIATTSNAQGIINSEPTSLNSASLVSNELLTVSNQNTATLSENESSSVFVNQIGSYNQANFQNDGETNTINLIQNGDSNLIHLDVGAKTVNYTAIQNGDDNILLDYSASSTKQELQRDIQQNGTDQNIMIEGNNSMMDKMKIKMNTSSQTLIIRNTN